MHRDGPGLKRLAALSKQAGLDLDGRRLERWDQDGMLWPDEMAPAEDGQVGHLRALAGLTGRGRSNDRAARIMLARGFPARRVRDALARVCGCESATEMRLAGPPIAVDDSTEEGWASIEAEAALITQLIEHGGSPGTPTIIQEWTRSVLRWASEGAANIRSTLVTARWEEDSVVFEELPAGPPPSPEEVVHRLATNSLAMGIGNGPYDLSWTCALAGVSVTPDDLANLAEVQDAIGGHMFAAAAEAIVDAPVDLLVVGAVVAKNWMSALATMRSPSFLTDPDDRDELAACWSPLLLGMVKATRGAAKNGLVSCIQEAAAAELGAGSLPDWLVQRLLTL